MSSRPVQPETADAAKTSTSGHGQVSSKEKETIEEEKRQRKLSQKAIQNAIQAKDSALHTEAKELQDSSNDVYALVENKCSAKEIEAGLWRLQAAIERYEKTLTELQDIYKQDKWEEFGEQFRSLMESSQTKLKYANAAITRARNEQTDDIDDKISLDSKHTGRTTSSRASSSSSSARRKALAEVAAARQQANYDRLIAEKESERRQLEAEEELRRERMRAEHDRDMAILTADKMTAVAHAKLKAIEQAIQEEEGLSPPVEDEPTVARSRTQHWVNTQGLIRQNVSFTGVVDGRENNLENNATGSDRKVEKEEVRLTTTQRITQMQGSREFTPTGFAGNEPLYQPPTPTTGPVMTERYIEGITETNQRLMASLARQNLPKCHPDTFDGDATIFHPWKNSFKAMVQDAQVSPAQEISYLRKYTTGKVQKLVDNFRKRQYRDPVATLRELWSELERRFGNAATITNALLARLRESAKFNAKDKHKLQKFADVCVDVDSQLGYLSGLACLNYPNSIRPIVDQLPNFLQYKWEKQVVEYAEKNEDAYPGFHAFATLIQTQARLKNHPNVTAGETTDHRNDSPRKGFRREDRKFDMENTRVLKSETKEPESDDDIDDARKEGNGEDDHRGERYCPFHERKGHTLTECRAFVEKTLEERTEWIKTAGLCFRCLSPRHRASQCKANVKCSKCSSERHLNLLHKEKETEKPEDNGEEIESLCTAVCGDRSAGLSCSKIILLDVFHENRPNDIHRVYAVVDDQSNASMMSPELVDVFSPDKPKEKYFLSTCSNNKEVKYGRRVTGIIARSTNGTEAKLPKLVECDHIPQDKSEIPTPRMARQHPHLREIANEIPALDKNAKIQLLIGRDAPELLKVRAFKNGPKGAPWAQLLDLGWTISGQMCLDRVGGPVHISARRTAVADPSARDYGRRQSMDERRPSVPLQLPEYQTTPCSNCFEIKEEYIDYVDGERQDIGDEIYRTTPEDNETSTSIEDRRFLEIMKEGIHKNERGNWEMPLPFRSQNVVMPNNRSQALSRLNGLLRSFKKKPQMKKDYIEFLAKVFERGHAVPVSCDKSTSKPEKDSKTREEHDEGAPIGRVWYLPHFGVYHPKKRNQIRVVFDSSCEFKGTSLNKELLTGPDLANSLLGVLVRFRQEDTAVVCDIEQMFHSFHVNPTQRDYLRFLWFEGNDPSQEISEYKMNVHLFGNGPSPAVATYGMRKTADDGEESYGTAVKEFVHRDFYVDDGLTSRPTDEEAIELVKGAQAMLATANLRLHKIASNSAAVMEALPIEDRAKDVRDLDLRRDALPAQRSLGVQWDLQTDAFTFQVSLTEKPFTRRGVLSVVNSIYDPLGLAAPVILVGKLLLQQLVTLGKKTNNECQLGWDDPLPENLMRKWQHWRDELVHLQNVTLSRCYHPKKFGLVVRNEIHAFSDASKDAIATAIYLRQINNKGVVSVAFVFGQSRVASTKTISIPRLELCAAVLSTQAVYKLKKELSLEIDETTFYTDSKVVLGYVKNESRRFHVYVANRVQSIRNVSEPHQWTYVDTSTNPADLATRGINARTLAKSAWLCGPVFLKQASLDPSPIEDHESHLDENDPEVKQPTAVYASSLKNASELGSKRFERFSSWSVLQRAVANLITKVKKFKLRKSPRPPQQDTCGENTKQPPMGLPTVAELEQATMTIIGTVQKENFMTDIGILAKMDNLTPKNRCILRERRKELRRTNLYRLDPFVDKNGLVRVGGRLGRSELTFEEKHPVILPKDHYLSVLLIRHFHNRIHHQGRQITHGALRQAGYWVVGGHRAIAKFLGSCVTCKKLRGTTLVQHMADLPADRMETNPPFTNVGFDVFGPWTIRTRKLRGGAASSKRWGLVFTCLSSRAIHIEVLESMDASSFICALRRFFAIRGPAAKLRCDNGSNFVGGKSELDDALMEMDQRKVEKYVTEHGCEWEFNPPHASHFGGVWERQIGTIRRILDSMLLGIGSSQLDHELLVTLMAEVCSIVNNRPITAIESDIDQPSPLTPAMLLTTKTRPLGPPPGDFVTQDLYARRRWRRTQYLADQFWLRWRREYLQNLQKRTKWNGRQRDLVSGDVVLVKDKDAHRNNWPLGRVIEPIESKDGLVRKAKVSIYKDGNKKVYLRPISELVLLIPEEKTTSNPSTVRELEPSEGSTLDKDSVLGRGV